MRIAKTRRRLELMLSEEEARLMWLESLRVGLDVAAEELARNPGCLSEHEVAAVAEFSRELTRALEA